MSKRRLGDTGKGGKKSSRHAPGEGPVKVLLAEDEESFIDALVIGLTNEGFRVTVARDGVEALELFEETEPDIILLDLMLPKMSGIDVCRAIRARSQVPDHHGHGQGCRDRHRRRPRGRRRRLRHQALPPPRAGGPHARRAPPRSGRDRRERHGRRSRSAARAPGSRTGSRSTSTNAASSSAATRCTCAARSSSCCGCSWRTPGRVLTRDVLIDRVWGTDYIGDTKTLDVHIKRLRSRIEADPSAPVLITTVRGVGYRFAAASGQ